MINKSLRMLAQCPGVVAERILERSKNAESPDAYVIASVTHWEIDDKRRRVVAERRSEESRFERDDRIELESWDRECRAKALEALSRSNSVNVITLALWIESGLSGTEFARSENITRDCLYQRKLRARLEILERLDAMTAAYLYGYGFERVSIRRGETRRVKTVRAPRKAA